MLKMFSVYDSKAAAYITPFFLPREAMAVREFEWACNDPEHMFCRYPADYTLFMIGEFDDSTGFVTTFEHSQNLGTAASFKRAGQTSDGDSTPESGN